MNKQENYVILKKFALGLGMDLFGVADISSVKSEFMISEDISDKFDTAVCLALRVSGSVLGEIQEHPTRLYFHHYRTLNASLDQAAMRVANFIEDRGFLSLPIPASQILDWQNQKAHLSHKKIGYLSGLGWIGRNNLLVNERFGSQFRIVCLLTNMPLKTDEPVKEGCAECRLCLASCPAKAIKEDQSDFGHLECFEQLKEFQRKRYVDQYICGICVKACAGKNRKAKGFQGESIIDKGGNIVKMSL